DSDGEREVEGLVVAVEREILDGDLAHAHPSGGDFVGGDGSRLGASLRRAVDREDVAVDEAMCDGACGCTGTATDLQDAGMPLERQRVHHSSQSRRESWWHELRVWLVSE